MSFVLLGNRHNRVPKKLLRKQYQSLSKTSHLLLRYILSFCHVVSVECHEFISGTKTGDFGVFTVVHYASCLTHLSLKLFGLISQDLQDDQSACFDAHPPQVDLDDQTVSTDLADPGISIGTVSATSQPARMDPPFSSSDTSFSSKGSQLLMQQDNGE